jgi:hypothetical protein
MGHVVSPLDDVNGVCRHMLATRRRLFDRAVSDKALVTGYRFPFPAVGTIAPDGAGYTFVPAA